MIMRSCGGGLLNVTASDEIQRIDGNLMSSVNFPRLPGHRDESGSDDFEAFSSSVDILAAAAPPPVFSIQKYHREVYCKHSWQRPLNHLFSVKSAGTTNISGDVAARCTLLGANGKRHRVQNVEDHSHDFFGLLPAHDEAKGLGGHLQRVAEGAGVVALDAADVLVGNLEPLLLDVVDLRRGNRRAVRGGVARLSRFAVKIAFFISLLFCPAFTLSEL